MDCADAKLRMEPCASGALVPEELALFEEHIAACEGCRLELELVRAMGEGKAGEAGAPKSDDWTLDRIFGAEASKNPPAASPGSEPLPIAAITPGGDAPVEPAPAATSAADAPEAATIFETTPSATPPEAPEPVAPSASFEPAPTTAELIPAAPATPHDEPASSDLFDDPNPVTAISDEVLAAASAAAAALGPAPKAERAASMPSTPPPAAPPKEEPADENSWDFEPADAKPEGSLPKGSLFFAEETLARQGAVKKGKNTVKRIVLWGGGAVVGIALLAVSLWVGFFGPGGFDLTRQAPATKSAPQEPTTPVAAPESLIAPAPDGSVTGSPAATTQEVVTQPADEAVAPTPNAAVIGARALSGSGVPPIPPSTRSGSQPVAPRSTTGAPAATSSGKSDPKGAKAGTAATAGSTGSPKSGASLSPSSTPKPSAGSTSPPTETTRPAPQPLDPEQLELLAPPPVSTTPEQSVPFAGGTKGATGSNAPVRSSPAPQLSTAPAPAESAPATPPADAVQRPIDRLHLATVAAEQGSDLVALRKLRDTWKGLVRTSVGPDRMRAKRELGDCLWAIQSLTGRTADKREALAAYREYLLNAPAGGADPRTVARMRQLEDALAESK